MTEELKSQADYFKDEPIYLRKVIEELEQENKELKEFCVELERQKQKQHMQWFERCTEINVGASQYRSALEEIRKKVKNPITLSCFASAKFVLEQIDKKINEVLG